jgi:hypothetical protein
MVTTHVQGAHTCPGANNTIGTVFGGTARQNAWSLSPAGLTYAGGSGCSIPRGQQRLRTGGVT